VLHESEDLFTLIESHEGRPLKLYVYNIDDDNCREVTIKPFSKWGGEGSLGCGIGYGYLHRIPVRILPDEKRNKIPDPPTTEATPLIPHAQQNYGGNVFVAAPPGATGQTNPNIPYVPPLANTFSKYLHPSTPEEGVEATPESDVAAGLSNLSLNSQPNDGQNVVPEFVQTFAPTAPPVATTSDFFAQSQQSTGSAGDIPMYSPSQFTSVPAPTPIPNYSLQSHNYAPPTSDVGTLHAHHTGYVPMNPYPFEPHTHPMPGSVPVTSAAQPFNPALLSYPASALPPPASIAPQVPTQSPIPTFPPMQTYSTYPQVQGGPSGTSVTTPISLPGMPPITVSTTLPPQALEGIHFNPAMAAQALQTPPPTTGSPTS
jgi:hypothetical protein